MNALICVLVLVSCTSSVCGAIKARGHHSTLPTLPPPPPLQNVLNKFLLCYFFILISHSHKFSLFHFSPACMNAGESRLLNSTIFVPNVWANVVLHFCEEGEESETESGAVYYLFAYHHSSCFESLAHTHAYSSSYGFRLSLSVDASVHRAACVRTASTIFYHSQFISLQTGIVHRGFAVVLVSQAAINQTTQMNLNERTFNLISLKTIRVLSQHPHESLQIDGVNFKMCKNSDYLCSERRNLSANSGFWRYCRLIPLRFLYAFTLRKLEESPVVLRENCKQHWTARGENSLWSFNRRAIASLYRKQLLWVQCRSEKGARFIQVYLIYNHLNRCI